MMWKGLSIAADSPSPIVVVLSGSMEPAFQRGDLLVLWNRYYPTDVGDIVVYKVKVSSKSFIVFFSHHKQDVITENVLLVI